jgi:hypothetical protein
VPASASISTVQPQRQRELALDVAEQRAAVDGHVQRLEVVVEDLVQRQRAVVALAGLALGEGAQHDAGHAVEHAADLERAEHAVDAVDVLVDVFQHQDGAVEGRPVG